MSRPTSLAALLLFFVSLSAALEATKQIEVHTWPLSASKSQLYAVVEYNSSFATTSKVQAPRLETDEKLVRLGHYQLGTQKWSGIVTSGSNLGTEKEQVILIHIDNAGAAYHVGLRTKDKANKADTDAVVSAEIVPLNPAPTVHFNKPVVLAADGQVEGPPEKTFLQKYWWAIGLFLLLQLVMGSSDKK